MPLYAVATFLGAFLLFQIQPILGKHLLPWFGGTPAVWTVCLLFFQTLLLGGYAWAHLLSTRLSARGQALAQGLLCALALAALGLQVVLWGGPLLPGEGLRPSADGSPLGWLVLLLALGVGLPYLALSSLSPLLQAWLHRDQPRATPYRLYVLSNAGSLLALLSYPFGVEPALPLGAQAWVWAALFGLLLALLASLALRAARAPADAARAETPARAPGRAGGLRVALWLGLPAAASSLLIAVTNQLSQEVAVVPFLWVLPLTLYLLSFILTFDSERWYRRAVFGPAFALSALAAAWLLHAGAGATPAAILAVLSAALFTGSVLCHGELVRLRPHPRQLTAFYLCLSAGGALGGLFCALLAPALFSGYFELHTALVATALLALLAWAWAGGGAAARGRGARAALALAPAWALALAIALGLNVRDHGRDAQATARNFYGVLRIETREAGTPEEHLVMLHGSVVHGGQYVHDRAYPATAFGPGSLLADAIRLHPRRLAGQPMRLGVVGMGVGTIAAHGRAGDALRLYELNPQVAAWARGEGGFFSYLRDTPARWDIRLGDARMELERERAAGDLGRLDVLVVDAFSSASPPVHLLTIEAFHLYLEHLAEGGVLAVHLSNANLDLGRLVARQAEALGLPRAFREHPEQGHTWGAAWMLMTHNEALLARPELAPEVTRPGAPGAERELAPWTDAFSNLFDILY